MTDQPNVVVTGLGTTNPLGGDVESTWAGALAGRSGVRTLEQDWVTQYELPVTFAGQLAVPAGDVLARQEMRRMDPSAQFAIIAARQAWSDAGAPDLPGERIGAVIASGIGGVTTLVDAWDTIRDKGARRVLPLTVPMLMPNSPAAYVSIEVGAKAGSHTPVSACASGAEAIGYALEMIRTGRADVVVAGGTEAATHPLPIASFAKMQALSTRNDDPAGASRPYDVNRDGFVLGEGAAVLVLEREEHAIARGATIYARVCGAGMTADAYSVAPPDPSGAGQSRALQLALEDAAITAADLVHVNAHATSTPAGDGVEAAAIRAALGDDADHVAVSATKSMTGHLLGGAGALESLFTILAVRDHKAPPTINVSDPEPGLPIDLVRDTPRELPPGQIAAVNNAFGFGGHNVALVITSA
ncbi:beta-ketoacyl-[acyl-carrier-protein] synthase family protein [Ruania halotolerans]|uniref:beta-ketoacyl-[acyl-carrier-protein] synthase family protein n=1 Tax=Ruania halotolerans TaxID=2897773 RepID=UPI001E3902B6|nr:beta-ketoacyl-[acyl-carrier-protein] synthase family protein [Ruania halotolerans]UFU04901.1 beta-ketoacyl-[acyl-carrier-protein] synthase family protein [Ruania halotolerans]